MFASSSTIHSKSIDYRQIVLEEQLDWLTVDHDDLQQDISERIATPKYHPSMGVIDQWEQEAIERIRHTAILARRALIDAIDRHTLEVQERLNQLTLILNEARSRVKSFNENDIQQWTTTLHDLKQMPSFPVIVNTENSIHGITINLCKDQRIRWADPLVQRSIPFCLASTLHDVIPSTLNSSKSTEINQEQVQINNHIYSNISSIIAPSELPSQEDQSKNRTPTTLLRIRRAQADIPFDSRANYPLRTPATIYH